MCSDYEKEICGKVLYKQVERTIKEARICLENKDYAAAEARCLEAQQIQMNSNFIYGGKKWIANEETNSLEEIFVTGNDKEHLVNTAKLVLMHAIICSERFKASGDKAYLSKAYDLFEQAIGQYIAASPLPDSIMGAGRGSILYSRLLQKNGCSKKAFDVLGKVNKELEEKDKAYCSPEYLKTITEMINIMEEHNIGDSNKYDILREKEK